MPIDITITSDFICPWCLVGERRLTAAIEKLGLKDRVNISWRPFELNPTMPVEGMTRRVYRSLKYGSWQRSLAMDAQTVAAASNDRVNFNYGAIERTPNTHFAHRMMVLAWDYGLQSDLADAILSAYFEQGRDIGDPDVLVDIAASMGIPANVAADFLLSDFGIQAVNESLELNRHNGVQGVPYFTFNGEALSGAQSQERFEEILSKLADGEQSCADGFCTA